MSVIGTTMRDDSTFRLLSAGVKRVRRWPDRRSLVLLSAVAMFVCIFLARQVLTAGDAISVLYVIPVALLALEMGARAGLLAALAATAAVAVWMASTPSGIGAIGLMVRALIFVAVGVCAGRFSDQVRAQRRREEILLQRRLLAVEREQVALISEIERMRARLGDQVRNASHLIEHHEQERRGIAKRLHDEAAQAMAGALLTVSLLERGVDAKMSAPQLEQVRRQVKACIIDLRRIAGSLRPPALDEMGLAMALERFAEIEDGRQSCSVQLTVGPLPEQLPPEVETCAYRAIEEMLEEIEGAGFVFVSVGETDGAVQIVVEAHAATAVRAVSTTVQPAQVRLGLAAAKARVELVGGSLEMVPMPGGGKRVLIEMPTVAELL